MDHLALYSKNCKRCSSLDPDEPRTFKSCHFDAGNSDCPAKEVQFVVVGKAKRLANAVLAARKSGDLAQEAAILQDVNGRGAAFQYKFKEWLSK